MATSLFRMKANVALKMPKARQSSTKCEVAHLLKYCCIAAYFVARWGVSISAHAIDVNSYGY
jgi:hypothetical protein